MFNGINMINLDAKGRFAMPTRYREELQSLSGGKLVMTLTQEPCLSIYPMPEWEEIQRKIMRMPTFNHEARKLQRIMIGHATECELDNNGRVLVAPPLREQLNLGKRVALIGQGNRFELWDEQTWKTSLDSWIEEGLADSSLLPPELQSLSL